MPTLIPRAIPRPSASPKDSAQLIKEDGAEGEARGNAVRPVPAEGLFLRGRAIHGLQ